jgi:hypothetical protein
LKTASANSSLSGCLSCNLPSLCWRQLVGAGFPALRSAELPKGNSGRISVIGHGIGRLTCCNVSDEFRERERVARAFLEFSRHAAIIAQSQRRRIAQWPRISN